MADLITPPGSGSTPLPGALSGQYVVYGGGGARVQLLPEGSSRHVPLDVQKMAQVPHWLPRNDGADFGRPESNGSLGIANQPVLGGTPAPAGYSMGPMYDPRSSSAPKTSVLPVVSPSSTQVIDPLGQLVG